MKKVVNKEIAFSERWVERAYDNLRFFLNVNLDNKISNFCNNVTAIVKNEINHNNESLKTAILAELTERQFFLNMQTITIEAEVDDFYACLRQFETQLYTRHRTGRYIGLQLDSRTVNRYARMYERSKEKK